MTRRLEHGTYAGYQTHRRAHEAPCELCRAASRGYQQGVRGNQREGVRTLPDELTVALLRVANAYLLGRPVPQMRQLCAEAIRLGHARNQPPKHAELPECGTRGVYQRHRYYGEKACEACRDANTEYLRRLKEGKGAV